MNEQQNFWKKTYSSDYISKNSTFDYKLGLKAWARMLKFIIDNDNAPQSVLECGSNIGRNINFLNGILPNSKKSIIEISEEAYNEVNKRYNIFKKCNTSILDSYFDVTFDLVFTQGVLIHIHPDDLLKNMKKIFQLSNKYILIGEYFNRTPVMLDYQGQKNKLFKNNFGKVFQDNFNVSICDYGFLWGEEYDSAGFDDITFWLFKKI